VKLPHLIAVIGATGTGKSDFSLDLAQALAENSLTAEIVNADAMQLYRGMDIGTAKLSPDLRRGFAHHLFDVLSPSDEAAVSSYQEQAREVIEEILSRGHVPILVGGSGLYVSSVLFSFDFPGHDDEIRSRLENELATLGASALYARLCERAPEVAARIDAQNPRRIVRALEVVEVSGDGASLGELPETPNYWLPTTIFGLRSPREELVARLDRRVEQMWENGLIDEVRSLEKQGLRDGVTSQRAIGYAQALDFIDGTLTQQQAIEHTQVLTRRYARRQVSWFKRYQDVHWLESSEPENVPSALSILGQ
jgi:tRNA dimethylallyltransferase